MTLAATGSRLSGLIVSNGTGNIAPYLEHQPDGMSFVVAETGPDFMLQLEDVDLLLVPNGSDHVALGRAAATIRAFLDRGGLLLCFDGWVSSWVPGHAWVMDNRQRTADTRYAIRTDRLGIMDGVDVDALTFRHGISGWWACGYIDSPSGADVLVQDQLGRAVIVVDTVTTNGTMVLTASGPVGPSGRRCEPDASALALDRLYANLVALAGR